MRDAEKRAQIEAQMMHQARHAVTGVGRMFGELPPEELATFINAMGDYLGVETRHLTVLLAAAQ